MDENKISQNSKVKLRIDIPNVIKPFFNRITSFPNMVKKVVEASGKINNKESLKVTINNTALEISKHDIKSQPIEKLIPEKYESSQKMSSNIDRYTELGQRSIESNQQEFGLKPLSESEKIELENLHKIINPQISKEADKTNTLLIEDINLTPEQSKSISDYEEYGTGSILMLEPEELQKIPDVIDGHKIADYQKMDLLSGGLEFKEYGTAYNLENHSIVKTQLNDDLVPEKTVLKKTDVVFDIKELNNKEIDPLETPEITQAKGLPEGWKWTDYPDGSGSLRSPENKSFYSYDLETQEFQSPSRNNSYEKVHGDFNLKDFKKLAEEQLLHTFDIVAIDPKLSPEEQNSLSAHRSIVNGAEMSGEKIKNVVQEVINDPAKMLQFDSNYQSVIIDYIKTAGKGKEFDMNFSKTMADKWALEHSNKTDLSKGMTSSQIDEIQARFYRNYESAAKELNLPVSPFVENNSVSADLNESQQRNLAYLEKNILNLGFTNDKEFKTELLTKFTGNEENFSVSQSTDKNFFKSNTVSFDLKFHRSKDTGTVFFNSYQINLENQARNSNLSHNVNLRQIPFSAKEAINLIEGRSVRTDINFRGGTKENVFVKLDFNSPKENGNFNLRKFFPEYGVNTSDILIKSNVFIAPNKEDIRDKIIRSLEKGNVVPILIKNTDGKTEKLNAVLNPHYKTLNLYNNRMERVNEKQSLSVGAKQETNQTENISQKPLSRK
jgi:hypothetical protein